MVFLPLWPLVAKLLGLYDRDHRALRHLTADEVPGILAWVAIVTALVALLLPLTPAGSLGGLAIGGLFVAAAVAAIGLRSFTRWAWWRRTPPELRRPASATARRSSRCGASSASSARCTSSSPTERRIAELGTGAARDRELRDARRLGRPDRRRRRPGSSAS